MVTPSYTLHSGVIFSRPQSSLWRSNKIDNVLTEMLFPRLNDADATNTYFTSSCHSGDRADVWSLRRGGDAVADILSIAANAGA